MVFWTWEIVYIAFSLFCTAANFYFQNDDNKALCILQTEVKIIEAIKQRCKCCIAIGSYMLKDHSRRIKKMKYYFLLKIKCMQQIRQVRSRTLGFQLIHVTHLRVLQVHAVSSWLSHVFPPHCPHPGLNTSDNSSYVLTSQTLGGKGGWDFLFIYVFLFFYIFSRLKGINSWTPIMLPCTGPHNSQQMW